MQNIITNDGIKVTKLFGLGKDDILSGGAIKESDISPKQVVGKGFIDAAIFDKLFDAVSYGERDKTQKKTATTTTGKQTRRERSL
jgi:hypothetical protein